MDKKWESQRSKPTKVVVKNKITICRVIPAKIVGYPEIYSWIAKNRVLRVNKDVEAELNTVYKELGQLMKDFIC